MDTTKLSVYETVAIIEEKIQNKTRQCYCTDSERLKLVLRFSCSATRYPAELICQRQKMRSNIKNSGTRKNFPDAGFGNKRFLRTHQ